MFCVVVYFLFIYLFIFFFFWGGGGGGPFFSFFFMFGHSLISIKRGLIMFKTLRNFCERFLFSKTMIQYSLYRRNMQTKVWFWILGKL